MCRVWSSVSTHYSVNPPAEPSASDRLPAAAAAPAPPSARPPALQTDVYKQTETKSKMIQILCAVCASATWAAHYLQSDSAALISLCRVVFACGGGWVNLAVVQTGVASWGGRAGFTFQEEWIKRWSVNISYELIVLKGRSADSGGVLRLIVRDLSLFMFCLQTLAAAY